jgi:hypothetical protein
MRKITFLLIAFLVLSSCGVKTAQSQLSSGDYDQAIETATANLRNNKDKKRKQDYIYMLEEAFAKAKQRDMANIELWAKETSPSNFEKIYDSYIQLNKRQEKIRPLLPLKLIKENRNAIFPFENYSDEIVSSKNALSKYLYDNAAKLVKSGNKMDSRKAYDDLIYLESINPDFKDTKKLMDEARFKGTDFVSVYTKNETNIMIPVRLENDLLDFSTFGLNDKWTVYHGNRQKNIDYDYGVIVNFRDIKISPEQVKEKEFTREKEIKDGKKKLLDRNGNVVLDSLGQPVMVDKIRTVRIKVNEFRQFKACQVGAKVDYIDFRNNQLIESFPLASEFIFENIYAKFRGDKRAIDEGYLENFDRHPLPFPSNEQMVYDSGEDLKAKLKTIISKHHFRR